MRKTSNLQVTPSVAQVRLDRLMQVGFAMVREELECPSDHELAQRCGLSSSYVHYLSLKRHWPTDAISMVAAASGRHIVPFLVAVEKRADA